jgi:hypothetical protein
VLSGSLSLGENFKYMYKMKSFADEIFVFVKDYDFKKSIIVGKSFEIDLRTIYHLGSCWNFVLSMSDTYNSRVEYKKLVSL